MLRNGRTGRWQLALAIGVLCWGTTAAFAQQGGGGGGMCQGGGGGGGGAGGGTQTTGLAGVGTQGLNLGTTGLSTGTTGTANTLAASSALQSFNAVQQAQAARWQAGVEATRATYARTNADVNAFWALAKQRADQARPIREARAQEKAQLLAARRERLSTRASGQTMLASKSE